MASKYDESNYIENLDYFDARFYEILDEQPFQWFTISKQLEYRIDLISKVLYNTTDIAIMIKHLNRISNIEELSEGRKIKVVNSQAIDNAIRIYLND